jgi:DNA repair protein RadA/Sms
VLLYPNIVLEGDLCIIFGQSGIGKTIFAMQVAREIATKGKRVLYADFEMTLRQLCLRYESANFPPTFFRAEMDKDNLVDDVLRGIEQAAVANLAEVVFIDNITALSQSLDKGTDAGALMASLNALKKKYNWTLVVLNHVPKMYSGTVPLSLSAIQGSAKLNQLIDDAVGLAQSQKDKSLVYVKQCKWRNGEVVLDADNVALYERGKNAEGNLCFTFRGYDTEIVHLSTESTNERDELRQRVKELSAHGMRQQDIAKECGITQSKVSRLLNS